MGVSDFGKLISHRNSKGEGYIFVDKSMLIKNFIDLGTEVTLITRPRRFGKTLNLSMLAYFFSKTIEGKPTKGLFDGLKVSQYPETMAKQGKHPTLFLTLKGIGGNNYKESIKAFAHLVSHLFQKHEYLLDNGLKDSRRKEFNRLLNKEASIEELKNSLQFLAQCLYAHTGKKVVILIDEYDAPLHLAYLKGYYKELKEFMKTFFSDALKDSKILLGAVVTGILKIAKASLFSDLNNLQVYTTLDSAHYADAFGFTEKETDDLLDQAGLPQKAHQLKEMYNGYEIEGITLYNPFSIISFAQNAMARKAEEIEKSLKPYWINTGSMHLIGDMLENNPGEVEEDLRKLVRQQPIHVEINEEIVFDKELTGAVAFWSIMLLAGYVQSTGREKNPYGFWKHTLAFPNKEVRESMRHLLLRVAMPTEAGTYLIKVMEALVTGDTLPFITLLEDSLSYILSHHDGKGRYGEQFYHGLILGMSTFFLDTHHVRSNRESGRGRYDIALEPKDTKGKERGIILEIKAVDDVKKLEKSAKGARQQIETGQYKADMVSRGVKEFILLGVAFCGQEVVVDEG